MFYGQSARKNGGHRIRTDISGSKVLCADRYTRPQVHRRIRTVPNGFADRSDHQILRTNYRNLEAGDSRCCQLKNLFLKATYSVSSQYSRFLFHRQYSCGCFLCRKTALSERLRSGEAVFCYIVWGMPDTISRIP